MRMHWTHCTFGGACAALSVSASAIAGAWPMEPGRGQVIVSYTAARADDGFDPDANLTRNLAFAKDEWAVFVEHGLTPRLTLVARPAYQWLELEEGLGRDVADGWAASQVGLRAAAWRRADGRAVASIQAAAFAPGTGENAFTARFGAGDPGAELRALAGLSWGGPMPGFVDAQTAVRQYGGETDTRELHADVTAGLHLSPKWTLTAQTFSVWGEPNAQNGGDEFARHKVQLASRRAISSRVSFELAAYDTLAGRTAVADHGVTAAVWLTY